jgi:hypothetical protein
LRWSAEILDEMERNLVSTGTTTPERAARTRAAMEKYFPEAEVTDYAWLIPTLRNQAGDRHVVAAAVAGRVQVIVTANLEDFEPLPSGIDAQSPDEFLCCLFDLDPDGFVDLLYQQADDLVKPPVPFEELRHARARPAPLCAEELPSLIDDDFEKSPGQSR